MPHLIVQGKQLPRVVDAKVLISNPGGLIPICQFLVRLPVDSDTFLAEWALAPIGPMHWKTVELQTLDRAGQVNHVWTLLRAFVQSYEEIERQPLPTDSLYIELLITGTLIHGISEYDGTNILQVQSGSPGGSVS